MKLCSATFLIISLLLLASQSGATTITCANVPVSALAVPLDVIGFSLMAMVVSFNVIAVAYIISKIIPGTQISGWVNEEFLELAKTGLLICAIFSVLVFMSNVAAILTLPGSGSGSYATNIAGLTKGACNYLDTLIYSPGGFPAVYDYILSLSTGVGALQGLDVAASIPLPLPPVPPWAVILWSGFEAQPYANPLFESTSVTFPYESILNDFYIFVLFPVTFVIYAQEALLPTLVYLALVVMIPFGIVFRAFPLVRSIGGTFVAIGIGVAIIYPAILVVFNGPVTNALAFGTYSSSQGQNCGSNPANCYISGIFLPFFSLGSPAANAGFSDGFFGSFQNAYPGLNGMIFYGFFLILQFMLFIADLMIVYPIMETIARSLGGTIQLSLGGKLKLA